MAANESSSELITLTFGDMAENHKGMEMIGEMVKEGDGFQYDDLLQIQSHITEIGAECTIYQLSNEEQSDAYLLHIKDGVNALLEGSGYNAKMLFEEQKALQYDKQAFMYGRVVNKHARWNLCFDEKSREPDYQAGKGRIIGFNEVPIMSYLKKQFELYFGEKAKNLKVESNYYYDTRKCGIGFHGDSERRKVIGVRIGNASMPIYYQWYFKGEKVGDLYQIPLDAGDIYVMSEKTVGTDWKKKNIFTLRHATGADKFITP
jgi:hypothetical protein